ncbi:hypothetical protein QWZ14_27265 [Paeniroseomonas aquatica]|uniref:Uncharacterized protein n=1 Tax=Paeniroseomonas aquatica TaxID=373043 RepID=A0ABT8AEG4_9PROT|nr:hypothetical protein [Paeniroseomonas aquatica]MDN3568098.1 hypothetical protein [Paeniroseomonas aquatica]
MAWTVDARIPLLVVTDAAGLAAALAGGEAAVLAEAPAPAIAAMAVEAFEADMPHAIACTCCNGRSPAAAALDRLFQARVRGRCGWFTRVVALAGSEPARVQVAEALAGDALTSARFRPA